MRTIGKTDKIITFSLVGVVVFACAVYLFSGVRHDRSADDAVADGLKNLGAENVRVRKINDDLRRGLVDSADGLARIEERTGTAIGAVDRVAGTHEEARRIVADIRAITARNRELMEEVRATGGARAAEVGTQKDDMGSIGDRRDNSGGR